MPMRFIALILSFLFLFTIPSFLSCFFYFPITETSLYYPLYFLFIILSAAATFTGGFLTLFVKNKYLVKKIFITGFLSFILLITMTATTAVINKIILRDLPAGSNYKPFNQDEWKLSDKKDNSKLRQYMLKDIIQNILPDKNKDEIINLLGAPDGIDTDSIDYITGPGRNPYLSDNIEVLKIVFDDSQQYARCYIITDTKNLDAGKQTF